MYCISHISNWMINSCTHSVFQWNGGMIVFFHKNLYFMYIIFKGIYFNEHATINEWPIYCQSRMVRGLSLAMGCSYDIRTFRCIQWLAGPPAWTGRGHQSFPQSDLWNNEINNEAMHPQGKRCNISKKKKINSKYIYHTCTHV